MFVFSGETGETVNGHLLYFGCAFPLKTKSEMNNLVVNIRKPPKPPTGLLLGAC